MRWTVSHRADPFAREIADRHYNRQKIGTPQFVPPGRCLVLTANTDTGRALWITSWPFAEYVKHAWPGAWVCSAFRNEGAGLAHELGLEALAATVARWPAIPPLGLVTFLNRKHVTPIKRRGRDHYGYIWELMGFRYVGETAGGLMAWQLLPDDMPEPCGAIGSQPSLFESAA
jgi:hypothetical protein